MAEQNIRLGKRDYVHDDRTLMLAKVMPETLHYQPRYDFDKDRAKFPIEMWGNDQWGDCVKVGQANQLIRLERLENRTTLQLEASDVVHEYQVESQREFGHFPPSPGTQYDQGLDMLTNLKNWRSKGFHFDNFDYKIAAFGELEPVDTVQLRQAVYNLHGVQFGFALPLAVQGNMTLWDYKGETGDEWKPGSWGGHCVFSKAYDEHAFEVITWATKVKVTDAFVKKYADEAWAVVDSFDSVKHSNTTDVEKLKEYLVQVGASGIQE